MAQDDLAPLVDAILAAPVRGARRLVAVAGPPGAGKSTIAERITAALEARGTRAVLVPMDGFHLDNRVLAARGLLGRKGAPETFDAAGFRHAVVRLAEGGEVILPSFDRARDLSVAGSVVIAPEHGTVVVEGNYLLLDEPEWRDLAGFWDLGVALDVDMATLRARLVQRWRDHGLSPEDAAARAEGNDLRNARRVLGNYLPADLTWPGS